MSFGTLGFFGAVIFDLDGVIVDSQKLHAREEHLLLADRGIHISPEELTYRFSGVSMHNLLAELFKEHGYTGSIPEAVAEKRRRMDSLPDTEFEVIPQAPELIEALHRHGVQLAVASASGLLFIERMVRLAGVAKCFYALASSREVAQGKPAPDVFLLAAQRLRVDPAVCIVIEDGISGMHAARAAKMRCIGFVQPHLYRTDTVYPADTICATMSEIRRVLAR